MPSIPQMHSPLSAGAGLACGLGLTLLWVTCTLTLALVLGGCVQHQLPRPLTPAEQFQRDFLEVLSGRTTTTDFHQRWQKVPPRAPYLPGPACEPVGDIECS